MPLDPPADSRIAGILLAAGRSLRMGDGRSKMLCAFDGEPLVRRAARRSLAAGVDPLVVVVGYEADRVRAALRGLPCECVLNADFGGPTSASLHAGLGAVPLTVGAAVVLLGDMVAISEGMLAGFLAAARGSRAPLIVSRYGAVWAPPIVFRRSLFAELAAWNGEGCGKAVVRRHQDTALFVDWPSARLADVDTPGDLQAFSGLPA